MAGLIVIAVLIALGAVLYLLSRETEVEESIAIPNAYRSNSNAFDDREWRNPVPNNALPQRVGRREAKKPNTKVLKFRHPVLPVFYAFTYANVQERISPVLGNVMNALDDPSIYLIGVYDSQNPEVVNLIELVRRRVLRDLPFGMFVKATVTRNPDVGKIQEDIARELGLTFNHRAKHRRANELIDRIKNEQKILIVLCEIYKRLDLSKVGIPYGSDHWGCKILLTAPTENVLSNHMRTQINFKVQ